MIALLNKLYVFFEVVPEPIPLYSGNNKVGELDLDRVMTAYDRHLRFVASHAPTYKEYVLNMDEKMQNPEFLGDTTDLLRPKLEYNPQAAWERVRDEIVAKLLPSK